MLGLVFAEQQYGSAGELAFDCKLGFVEESQSVPSLDFLSFFGEFAFEVSAGYP